MAFPSDSAIVRKLSTDFERCSVLKGCKTGHKEKKGLMTYNELPENAKVRADIVLDVIANDASLNSRRRACKKLCVCGKTLTRYINGCRQNRYEVFVHGNRGRQPVTVISADKRNEIVRIYLEMYPNASFTHFREILRDDYGINVSTSSLENILKHESFVVSPLANKSTVIKYTQKLKRIKGLEKKNNDRIATIERAKYLLEETAAGARKPRKQYMGELVEMDASSLVWVQGKDRWHLHLAVDDATGEIVGAYFDTQETLHGYYMVLRQIIHNYGLPLMFRTDRRTCFEFSLKNGTPESHAGRYRKKPKERLEDENPALTHFGVALEKLGIELQAHSDPLFKSRIERLNYTFQCRLPVDLKRAKIETIAEANAFLPSYITKLNGMFSHKTDKDLLNNVFVDGPDDEELNLILSVRVPRTVTGSTVKFENRFWALYGTDGRRVNFRDKAPCTVIKALNGTFYGEIDGKRYFLQEVAQRLSSSTALGEKEDVSCSKLEKKPYIPPVDHPWRKGICK
jgi:Integrase core domain.